MTTIRKYAISYRAPGAPTLRTLEATVPGELREEDAAQVVALVADLPTREGIEVWSVALLEERQLE